jgi:hypothetical protein
VATGERVLVLNAPGRVWVHTDPPRGPLSDGLFDVQTLYSGLSTCTELTSSKEPIRS